MLCSCNFLLFPPCQEQIFSSSACSHITYVSLINLSYGKANVMPEKDGEKQLDRSCKKCSSQAKEERNILHTVKRRKASVRRNCLLKRVIEGKWEGRIDVWGRRGKRRKQLPDDLKETRILETETGSTWIALCGGLALYGTMDLS